MIAHFVGIGGIVDHNCLSFLFITLFSQDGVCNSEN